MVIVRDYRLFKEILFLFKTLERAPLNIYLIKYQVFCEFNDAFLPGLIYSDIIQENPGDGFNLYPDDPEWCFYNLFTDNPRYIKVIEFCREMIPAVTVVIHPEYEHGILA